MCGNPWGNVVTEIGRSIGVASARAWYRHAGSTLAMALGAIYIAGSLVPPSPSLMMGLEMMLGALAYRSAKKRQLGEVEDNSLRQISEVLLLVPVVASVVLQRDLRHEIATDPVSVLVIPVWCVLAYAVAAFRAWRR